MTPWCVDNMYFNLLTHLITFYILSLFICKTLRNDTVLVDDEGHAMQAKDIFGHSIRYMKKRLLDDLQARGNMIRDENITWVVTIPAIWNDGAKQFMREAAIMVNLTHDVKQPLQIYIKDCSYMFDKRQFIIV